MTRNMVPGESVYGEKRIRWDSFRLFSWRHRWFDVRMSMHTRVHARLRAANLIQPSGVLL